MRPRPEDQNIRPEFKINKNLIITQATPSMHPLSIIRGTISSLGAIVSGEGFTVVVTGVTTFTITFTPAFMDNPSFLVTPIYSPAALNEFPVVLPTALSRTTATVITKILTTAGGGVGLVGIAFSFEATGQRA